MSESLRVVVTGGTGVVGAPLVRRLARAGHRVTILSRSESHDPDARVVCWTPEEAGDWYDVIDGADVLVHLARSALPVRWTHELRLALYHERIGMISRLVEAMSRARRRPSRFICASSHDYYGVRPSDIRTTEKEPACSDPLALMYADIEMEANRARALGVSVALARIGVVLGQGSVDPRWIRHVVSDPEGALSWIHREDAAEMLHVLVEWAHIEGPVNLTTKNPTTAAILSRHVEKLLGRPSRPIPPGNQDPDRVLFHSHWAYPAVMESVQYHWRVTDVRDAIAYLADRSSSMKRTEVGL